MCLLAGSISVFLMLWVFLCKALGQFGFLMHCVLTVFDLYMLNMNSYGKPDVVAIFSLGF